VVNAQRSRHRILKGSTILAIEHFDAIVIGAGQAGGPLATALAKSGRKTAIVEREHVGGTCINEGCTPTKTMVASARVAYLAGRASDYGVKISKPSIDLSVVRQRKRDIVESFRSGSERRIEATNGLDLIMGEARFTGSKAIEVRLLDGITRSLEADLFFINAGNRPAPPRLANPEAIELLDSTSIMELDTVPRHLIVLGGGYVGVEFGQMFRRFGSRVTIVQRGDQLLGREDADVAEAVASILREDGIEILFKSEATAIARDGNDLVLTVTTSGGERQIRGDHVLSAAGRTSNTDSLNLEATGVATDARGYIPTDNRLETNVPGIYALGDIRGGAAFTHISYDDFRIIRTNLIEGGSATIDGRLVPYTVYMDPQLGRIGLTETEARAAGKSIRIAEMPMSSVARALEVDESRGSMKVIVDAETDQILGCAILGIEGGEVMTMIQLAMMGNLPSTVLRETVFAHPTLAESLNNLFYAFREN
jgi:pyruvate/2-oxoglutarate dehydrogenase complex dihydrolipoamide dehydrogenase (E3) component